MAKLSDSWESPFDGATLNKAQLEAAAAAHVDLHRPTTNDGVLTIPEGDGSWINRWARSLKRNMGVGLAWSPLSNHYRGEVAAFSPSGWLWADKFGPLLTKPNSELLHEFLHAYIERGKHWRQFLPLKLFFINDRRRPFPKADAYKDANYARLPSFGASEILTNFHTLYHRALGVAQDYGTAPGDWTSSAYDAAPLEVQRLIKMIETPLFLSESVETMSSELVVAVRELAKGGPRIMRFQKSYHRMDGVIPTTGEVEENARKDEGFYETVIRDGAGTRLTVKFLSRGNLRQYNAEGTHSFPVHFSNSTFDVVISLNLDQVIQADIDNPMVQKEIVMSAARLLADDLQQLINANSQLTPWRERLKDLKTAGKLRVDLALVRKIRDAARAAFLAVTKHFIRQSARA